jgi:hypothetical protein
MGATCYGRPNSADGVGQRCSCRRSGALPLGLGNESLPRRGLLALGVVGALEVVLHWVDHGEMLLWHWSNWCLQHPA